MLQHVYYIGRAGQLYIDGNGDACGIAEPGEAGNVLYGPYESLEPGIYEVSFELIPDIGFRADGRNFCSVEVTDEDQKILARADVSSDCIKSQGITSVVLPVRIDRHIVAEYRLHSLGTHKFIVKYNRRVCTANSAVSATERGNSGRSSQATNEQNEGEKPGLSVAKAQAHSRGREPKTLIFCTAFSRSKSDWDDRYKRWLAGIRSSALAYDSILIVDDSSPVLPDWPELEVWTENDGRTTSVVLPELILYRFAVHLGRKSNFDFPGWYRSFSFAGQFAVSNAFEKVIHIESDACLISERVQRYFNDHTDGWAALWCPRYRFPESALQVITGDQAVRRFSEFAARRFSEFEENPEQAALPHRELERELPLDYVEGVFKGDRYGEYSQAIPRDADYAAQVRPGKDTDYYWWIS